MLLGKRTRSIILAALVFSCSVFPERPASAFHLNPLAKALLGIAVEYGSLNTMVNYYDNAGRNVYLGKLKDEYGVDHDGDKNALLGNIVKRLSNAYATKYPDVRQKPYNYFVNNKKTFNAFCTFGHNISVNSGLFDLLGNNPDEIAFVIAHEMGHGEEKHNIKGIRKSLPIDAISAIEQANSDSALKSLGVSVLARYAQANVVTKPQEWQADNDAFTYATMAGFNPGAGAALWQRVMEKMPSQRENFVGEIFSPSDHPTNEQRRENYARKLTAYSNNHVVASNGTVKINGKFFMKAASSKAMSSAERAYLIAGALSAVYHNNKTIPRAYVGENGYLYVGVQDICLPLKGELSAHELAIRFNKINNI